MKQIEIIINHEKMFTISPTLALLQLNICLTNQVLEVIFQNKEPSQHIGIAHFIQFHNPYLMPCLPLGRGKTANYCNYETDSFA